MPVLSDAERLLRQREYVALEPFAPLPARPDHAGAFNRIQQCHAPVLRLHECPKAEIIRHRSSLL